jgi:PAS domain-containing protein
MGESEGDKLTLVRSFRIGLALSCGVPLVLSLALFFWLTWKEESQLRTEVLLGKAEVITDRIVGEFELEDSVIVEEAARQSINAYLAALSEEWEEFSYISVLDPFGRVVHYSTDRAATVLTGSLKESVYALRRPALVTQLREVAVPLLTADGRPYGVIRLGLPDSYGHAATSSVLFRLIPIGLLSLLLTVGLSTFLSRRFLSRCLAPLRNSVDRVAEGDFTRRLDTVTVNEELIPLTSSLNRLFENIEDDKKRFHQLNSGLQEYEKLFVRTKSEGLEKIQKFQRQTEYVAECFQKLLEQTWEGVVVFDASGKVVEDNPQVRRMIRFERRGRDLFVPQRILRMISNLLGSTKSKSVEGSFEIEDGLFFKSCHYRFRAHRLPNRDDKVRVLVVLQDSTRFDQVQSERNQLAELIRQTVIPVVDQLYQELREGGEEEAVISESENAEEASSSDQPVRDDLLQRVASRANYLKGVLDDWTCWSSLCTMRGTPEPEPVQMKQLLQELPEERLGGFSEQFLLNLPDKPVEVLGSGEAYKRVFDQLLLLLQLAVPGRQETSIDMLSYPEGVTVMFRKAAAEDSNWKPPRWLKRLTDGQPLTQDSWINLKISIIRFLAGLWGIRLSLEADTDSTNPGVQMLLEIQSKQAAKIEDTAVEDLIRRFFVAQV